MEFVKIQNNIVVELISCDEPPKTNGDWRKVNLEGGIHVGDDVRMYDSEWNLRSLKDLVDEGFIKLAVASENDSWPKGTVLEKVENNQVVPKTRYELAKEGAAKLGPFEYLDDKNETIKTASSVEELVNVGKINEKEAEELKAKEIREHRDALLNELDEIVSNPLRWASLSDSKQKALADYRQKLLDVPQQSGFPEEVTWPTKP